MSALFVHPLVNLSLHRSMSHRHSYNLSHRGLDNSWRRSLAPPHRLISGVRVAYERTDPASARLRAAPPHNRHRTGTNIVSFSIPALHFTFPPSFPLLSSLLTLQFPPQIQQCLSVSATQLPVLAGPGTTTS